MRYFCFALAVCGLFLSGAYAGTLPKYFTLPPTVKVDPAGVIEEEYGEAEIRLPRTDQPNILSGRHWNAIAVVTGVTEGTDDNAIWARIKPALLKGGWKVVHEFDIEPFHVTLRLQRPGLDVWCFMWVAEELRFDIIERTALGKKIVLAAPGAKPEDLAANDADFPFLPPLAGSTRTGAEHQNYPMLLDLGPGKESQVVGNSVHKRAYAGPPGLSNLQFVELYQPALIAAGWKVLLSVKGLAGSDARIAARYQRNGRDVWRGYTWAVRTTPSRWRMRARSISPSNCVRTAECRFMG
jgi:hypothetical protein